MIGLIPFVFSISCRNRRLLRNGHRNRFRTPPRVA
jgi:hypothetical protein